MRLACRSCFYPSRQGCSVVHFRQLSRIRRRFGSALALFAGVLLGALSLGLNAGAAQAADAVDGKEAPDFALRTLDSSNLRLSEFRGQVVLINFWASWCGACRQAMPALNDLHGKYQRAGLVMLSINVDDEQNRASHMAASLGIPYPVLFDGQKAVSKLYGLQTMPLTILVDREGKVRFTYTGYNVGDERKFLGPLRELLNE